MGCVDCAKIGKEGPEDYWIADDSVPVPGGAVFKARCYSHMTLFAMRQEEVKTMKVDKILAAYNRVELPRLKGHDQRTIASVSPNGELYILGDSGSATIFRSEIPALIAWLRDLYETEA